MSEELHEQIARELGETQPAPVDQIRGIVAHLGPDGARALLEETQRVEAEGGMMIERLNRRRTPGGVFLLLARRRCSDEALAEIFHERRLPDGSYERLPFPNKPLAFGADWPGMTPEAYQRLCQAGIDANWPRMDILRALWVSQGESGLLAAAAEARAQRAASRKRSFSALLLESAYTQLPPEEADSLPPPASLAKQKSPRTQPAKTRMPAVLSDHRPPRRVAEPRPLTPSLPTYAPEKPPLVIADENLRAMIEEVCEQIARELGETQPATVDQIRRLVAYLGLEGARALLAETQRVEAAGGLTIERLNRRRTPGGVFLFLAHPRCDDQALAEIFHERRLPDGSYERLPFPKKPRLAFGADWPGMTPEAYQRLYQAGIDANWPRMDILRALWVSRDESGLLELVEQARDEKQSSPQRPLSALVISLAYAQLPPEEAARLAPPASKSKSKPLSTRQGLLPEKPWADTRRDLPAEKPWADSHQSLPVERTWDDSRRRLPAERTWGDSRRKPSRLVERPQKPRPPSPPVPPPEPEPEPVHPTLNIVDEELRLVARGAGISKPLTQAQVDILMAAEQALGRERLTQLAAQTQADVKASGVVAQNGERLKTPEAIFVYTLYARLNRAQRKALSAPDGWVA